LKSFIIRCFLTLFTFAAFIICIANFEVSNNYIYQKFENTQYNKINWFLQKAESGDFKNSKYKGVFLGSSQCYYGVNDSILGKEYLNLGMNTPSRALDLYMKTKFLESGGSADCFYIGFDGFKKVSYGLHPLLPYLVKPTWLLQHGQGFISLHFWKYILLRAQVVLDDIITPYKQVKVFDRAFGVGYLDFQISKNRKVVDRNSNERELRDRFNDPQKVVFWDEFRNNIQSQWNFFNKHKKSNYYKLILLPSFGNNRNTIDTQALDLKLPASLIYSHKYWADPGHLNRQGGIIFSKVLVSELND
jgi:hypothetical protein